MSPLIFRICASCADKWPLFFFGELGCTLLLFSSFYEFLTGGRRVTGRVFVPAQRPVLHYKLLPLSMNCTASCCCCCFPSNCRCPLWTMKVEQLFFTENQSVDGVQQTSRHKSLSSSHRKSVDFQKNVVSPWPTGTVPTFKVTKISMNMKGKFVK